MKIPNCLICGETDPNKFYGAVKSCCYECYKKKVKEYYRRDRSREAHLCLICGETDWKKFQGNTKIKCSACTHAPFKRPRGVRAHPELPLPQPKPPKFVCAQCGKTGEENFHTQMPRRCIECWNKLSTRRRYPFYDQLVEVQCGEFCAICGKTPKELGVWSLAVDHDHETGLVRGLLCSKCNWCPHFEAFSAVEARYKYLLNPPAKDLMIPFPEDVKSKLALNEWRKKNLYDIVKGKYVKKIAEETMDNLK